MGVARYSFMDPYNVLVAVVVAELCELRQCVAPRRLVAGSTFPRPLTACDDVDILRSAGKAFVERHSGPLAPLLEQLRPYRDLIPVEQGAEVIQCRASSNFDAFMDATLPLLAPVARAIAASPTGPDE